MRKSTVLCLAATFVAFATVWDASAAVAATVSPPGAATSGFKVSIAVFDLTTRTWIHRSGHVNSRHTYQVAINFIPPFLAGGGQYVMTAADASGNPQIVQSNTFTICCDGGTFLGDAFSVSRGNDWKISATLNGVDSGQFSADTFEFFTNS